VKDINRIARTMARGCQSAETGCVGGSTRPVSFPLRQYQHSGIQYLRRVNGCGCLFWEMRLGKTITTIRFLCQRADAKRILVVGPYSALAGWHDELLGEGKKDFIHSVYKIEPSDRQRFMDVTKRADGWFIVNKECHLYLNILSYQWDAIILDESWIANPRAKVTKYFLEKTWSKYRILLTGTPAPETELQYYSQLTWVNRNILNMKSFWDYRIRHFRPEGFDWRMTVRGRQFLANAIARNCSVLKRKDVNLQKEKIFKKWLIELSPKTRKRYADAEMALLDDEILKFAGQRWNMLRRLCSGPEKETELIALVKGELKKDKIIIWCNYVEEVERIAQNFDGAFIHGGVKQSDREWSRGEFLHGDCRVLVAQPECWKFGTNLSGVDTVIFFSLPSALMTWQQVCERTVDLTSDKSLYIISFLAGDTVEEKILEGLYAKEDSQKTLERIRRSIIARRTAERV
jgi:SNF2 family DNA or RNA helicase